MGVWDFLKGSRNRQNTGNSLMESFRSENWSKMNADQRLAALQKLENFTAGQEGRTARTVVPEKMDNDSTYGYFNETSSPNSLHINEKLLNGNGANGGYDAIDTLWHEGRHAYQYDAYSGRLLSTANPPDKDTQELWKANFDNDIYRNSGTAYYYQPIETDANRFARGKLKENENYFAGDPAYEKYQKLVEAEQTYYAESIDNMCGSDYEKQIADEIRQEYQERQEKGVAGDIEKADAEKTAPEGKLKHSWMDEPLSEAETAQLLENDPGYADGILPEKAEDYNETGRYRSAETDISEDERERLENEQLLENDPGDVNEKVLKEDDYYYATGMHRPDWGDDSLGEKKETTIPKGTVLDQYSHPDSSGKYFAPEGTAYEKLELNDVPEKRELHRYEVMKDIPMTESKVGQQNWNKGQEYDPENAATQYQSDMNADELVEKGYLKEIPVEKEQIEKPKDGEGVESKAGSETAKPEPKEDKETKTKEAKAEEEPKENKEAKAESEPKENKEAKAEEEPKENKEAKGEGEPKENKEAKAEDELKENKEAKAENEPKENKEAKAEEEPKENKEAKAESEPKENKEAKAEDEPKENKEAKGEGEPKENKEAKAEDELKENKEAKAENEPKENKEAKAEEEPKENKEAKGEGEPKENKETKGESEPEKNKEAKAENEPKENKEAKAENEPKPEKANEKESAPSRDNDYYSGIGY